MTPSHLPSNSACTQGSKIKSSNLLNTSTYLLCVAKLSVLLSSRKQSSCEGHILLQNVVGGCFFATHLVQIWPTHFNVPTVFLCLYLSINPEYDKYDYLLQLFCPVQVHVKSCSVMTCSWVTLKGAISNIIHNWSTVYVCVGERITCYYHPTLQVPSAP